MDAPKPYETRYTPIIADLLQGKLGQALTQLSGLLGQHDDWELKDRVKTSQEAYTMLLQYMAQGSPDSARTQMYRKFVREALELVEYCQFKFLLKESTHPAYATQRLLQRLGHDIQLLQQQYLAARDTLHTLVTAPYTAAERIASARSTALSALTSLFDALWSTPFLQRSEVTLIQQLLDAPATQVPTHDKSTLLSALLMGCLQVFDSRKLMLLAAYTEDTIAEVQVRASVGLVWCYVYHYPRMDFYPDVQARLALLQDNKSFATIMTQLQLQWVLTLETENIEKKMREDIIPSVMKHKTSIESKFGLAQRDQLEEMLHAEEMNPEWGESTEIKRIEHYLKQLSEMQAQGADVFMGTFAQLKQRYPFFQEMANWFYPFTTTHPALSTAYTNDVLHTFVQQGTLCDSDKYSLMLMLSDMPPTQRDLIEQQFSSIDHTVLQEALSLPAHQAQTETLVRSYVQDLYRFAKLYKYHHVLPQFFNIEICMLHYVPLSDILLGSGRLEEIAHVAFKQKSYALALQMLKKLSQDNPLKADTLQKIGYAYQQLGQAQYAITAYEQADLLKPHSLWTLRQLAACYRGTRQHIQAVKYYKQIADLAPEDLNVLLKIGEELIYAQSYEEALTYLYKVDYLSTDPLLAARAIAWSSFLLQKLPQAQKYYDKILATQQATAQDYINAGHVAWAMQDLPQAIRYYRKGISLQGDIGLSSSFLTVDAEALALHGITAIDRQLMSDALALLTV